MVSQCKIVCEGLHFYNMGCVSSKLGIKSPFTLLIFLFFCPRELPVTDTTSESSSSFAASRGHFKMSRKYGSKYFRERDIVNFVIFKNFSKIPISQSISVQETTDWAQFFRLYFLNPK